MDREIEQVEGEIRAKERWETETASFHAGDTQEMGKAGVGGENETKEGVLETRSVTRILGAEVYVCGVSVCVCVRVCERARVSLARVKQYVCVCVCVCMRARARLCESKMQREATFACIRQHTSAHVQHTSA